MKKRIISLLAVVAMLISMLTCIFIPANAADYTAKEAAKAIYDAITWTGNGTLKTAVQTAYGNAEYDQVKTLIKNGLEGKDAEGADLETPLSWKSFDGESITYPRFIYHTEFADVGYDGKNWSISDPADWTAMDTYAKAAEAGEYFKGVTFHLTTNIDFANTETEPLGAKSGNYFSGTIDGHGYGFSNVNVYVNKTYYVSVYTDTTKGNGSIGLIGFLGNCNIHDFGINSGRIGISNTGSTATTVSTFGCLEEGYAATFERVWSSGWLIAGATTQISGLVGGRGSTDYGLDVTVNGAVFDGIYIRSASYKYPLVTGILGGWKVTSDKANKYSNIVLSGDMGFYSAIDYPNGYTASTTATSGTNEVEISQNKKFLPMFVLAADGDFDISNFKNVYGITGTNKVLSAYAYGQNGGTIGSNAAAASMLKDKSVLEVAHEINSNPTNGTGETPVYFTKVGDTIRPVASNANAVAKVTFTCDEEEQSIFVNKGTAITKAEIMAKFDVTEAEVSDITVNGNVLAEDSFTVAGDDVVVVSTSDLGLLNSIADKYKAMEDKYLTAAAITAKEDFIARADAATTDDEALAVLATETALIAAMDTYHDYPMATGKEIPAYSLHTTYDAINKTQNWVIKTKEDWAAMRDVADVATEDYFKDATFHLVDDVDFVIDEAIAPMGINTNGAGFAGTLDGHGYGFNDIYVFKNDIFGDKTSGGKDIKHTGLFLRLADCTIKDFGLNSGLVRQTSSNTAGVTSSFGTVMEDKVPTLERVWSSAIIAPLCNASGTALVGTIDDREISFNLNGFVFDGQIIKGSSESHGGQLSFGIYGAGGKTYADDLVLSNVITDFASYNGKIVAADGAYTITKADRGVLAALLSFSSAEAYENAALENIYAVKRESEGINESYFLNSALGGYDSRNLLTDMSAVEAAWTINNDPSDTNPVYFTLKDGHVRPTASKENAIVKVTLTGLRNETYFFNNNSELNLASALKKTAAQDFAIVNGSGTISGDVLTLNGDLVINVTTDCTHAEYEYVAGVNEHTKTCKGCGYETVEDCSATSYTVNDITVGDLEACKVATHSGTCQFCNTAFTCECTYEYKMEAGKDNVWDYSACPCGRANITHVGVSPMLVGDANGDKTVHLLDAIRLLRNTVNAEITVNAHNADVDGDSELGIRDVLQIVRMWLGSSKALNDAAAVQLRVNTPNFYDASKATAQNIKMDGTIGDNVRFVVSEAIKVSKGNKLVFGPVREAQPVMGYFFDAQGNPMELINHTNIAVEYTFEKGMIMASVKAPEGAATAKLQVNAMEKDHFYARINNEFTVMDYQIQAGGDAEALANPEKDQYFLNVGDSLCSAARDSNPYGVLRGWARRIYQVFGSKVANSSEGGSTLSTYKLNNAGDDDLLAGETASSRQWIVNQLHEHTDIGRSFDYILLEGGGNDAAYDVEIGEISDSFDPATFDLTTYAGGLEKIIYDSIKEHGDTAAIGYMSIYPMPHADRFTDSGNYFEVGEKICEKWGIEYLNIYKDMADFDTVTYTWNGKDGDASGPDYIHANEEGYDIMQPHINAFIPKMRAVPKDVYLAVQQYAQTQE